MIDLGNGVKLVRRSEWGARPPRSRTGINPSFGSTCHWEGPAMGTWPHESCATKVRVIQNFHMDTRGWVDIAYTALACPHGYVFEGRWVGARTAANGTNDGNNRAYAICYLGGQGDPFTAEGARAVRAGLDYLDAHGGAGDDRNGHRDWKPTECPGDAIYRWVHAGQPVGPIAGPTPLPPQEDDMTDDERRMLADALAAANEAKFVAHALLDLLTPNGFRYVMPTTGETVAKGTPGAKPAADVWRWSRESVLADRQDEARHAQLTADLDALVEMHGDGG